MRRLHGLTCSYLVVHIAVAQDHDVFHFVTGGIESLEDAKAAAGGRDVRLLGGASTIRQYLRARLIDEMHFAVSPMLLGSGEHLLAGIDLPALGYRCTRSVGTERATHYVIGRA
jgi:dihydrofolate reductase